MGRPKIDRTGERFIDNYGCEYIIIKYNNYNDVIVEFQDEFKTLVHTKYGHCINKNVHNPYSRSIYNVGYIGVGKYKCSINNKITKCYTYWHNIFIRCFDEEFKNKEKTYKNVTMNKECYCLQDFGKWFDNNYYEIEGEQMCLDKDILCKGNKEYSFETMIFVPKRINNLFTKSDATRGEYPIGVSYDIQYNKYRSDCRVDNKNIKIGLYDTPKEAFLAYKEFKEAYIKQVADEYKGRIPDKLYDAMYRWEVEEDD